MIPVAIDYSMFFLTSFIAFVYRYWKGLKIDSNVSLSRDEHIEKWKGALIFIASKSKWFDICLFTFTFASEMWEIYGKVMYGYSVKGLDRIPRDKPAVIIYYHGALFPVDIIFLKSKVFLERGIQVKPVSDRFLINFPGWHHMCLALRSTDGTIDGCVQDLKNGEVIAIAPGGMREGLCSDNTYPLIWNGRKGFARVAHQARVPIIPVFTRNLNETLRTAQLWPKLTRAIYDWTRWPLALFYGGFPVRLTTFVGEPIHFDPDQVTVEEVAEMVK